MLELNTMKVNNYAEMQEKTEFILGNSYELQNDDFKKIIEFHNSFKTEESGFSVLSTIETYFIEQHGINDKRIKLTEKIYDWCWDNNIPMYNTIMIFTLLYIPLQEAVYEIYNEMCNEDLNLKTFVESRPNYEGEDTNEFIHKEVLNNFMRSFEEFIDEPLAEIHNSRVYQGMARNTYKKIRTEVKENIDNMKLPLDQYTLNCKDVLDDIKRDEDELLKIIDNPKRFVKIKQSDHFLNHLRKDFSLTQEGELIFAKHAEGLSIGYTSKAILLSLDKRSTIRELKSNLKFLKKYHDRNDDIDFTIKLIKFIDQRKDIGTIIPFKALAKELKITKNQAKNYAKRLFNINEKSFSKNFEEINILDTK